MQNDGAALSHPALANFPETQGDAELTAVCAQLEAVQADYAGLETRAGIAQSSVDLIRGHRDRLELLEEMRASQV